MVVFPLGVRTKTWKWVRCGFLLRRTFRFVRLLTLPGCGSSCLRFGLGLRSVGGGWGGVSVRCGFLVGLSDGLSGWSA